MRYFQRALLLSLHSLIFLILSGIATGLSWLYYFQALQTGLASSAAALDKTSLIIMLLLAMLFLGEPLQASDRGVGGECYPAAS
jgi:bacterial/archaeal transporter family protein